MPDMRAILHLDLDAFYCAVEEKNDPTLRGKPFAVGGRPESRGVVASCSYAARKVGVRSAMPMSQALRLCPELIVIPGNFRAYRSHSRAVMECLRGVTDLVEQISIDEAFLDVTGLQESPQDIARRLQAQILEELNLPCSLGVAANKLVAKIASDFGKAQFSGEGPPNALTVVAPGTEAAFLSPLPVRALWGIGPKTEERLNELGIQTIGDLARADPAVLTERFGKHGEEMTARAHGIDHSPLVTEREAKSFSQETTFARDVRDIRTLKLQVWRQANDVSTALRRRELTASTIKIKVRWPDFTTLTRQMTITQPTDEPEVIGRIAWKLISRIWKPGKPVRLIGVGVSGLGQPSRQLELWDIIEEKERTS